MREIIGDLRERADLVATQISAAQSRFDKLVEQLRGEHAARLDGLKSDLHTVRVVINIGGRRESPPPATNAQSELKRPDSSRPRPAQSQTDLRAHRVAAVSIR